MAMTKAGLKAAIISALGTAEDATKQAAFADALAGAIVDYFHSNCAVQVTIPASSINTTGSAAAQSGPPSPVNVTGVVL
jgi:hypothetical protein